MHDQLTPSACNLSTPYKPTALYYESADSLEYTRQDIPAVYRRVDGILTLVFSMRDRDDLIGFQIKGFKNFYLKDREQFGGDFLSLVGVLERIFTEQGGQLVDEYRREAYDRARKIALEDSVELHDLPKIAVQ
ncbi:MAG TPA: hypothetical protein VHZ26_09100 [Caulobacteraceae bacterium]|jgi:hypothetical protein|nr:hypothetical protein [Caulobacteraceae bacterium]